jgi:putative endonuclease
VSRRGRERAGRFAELLAAWLLRARGFRVLARRYATPVGEIDLVARRDKLLVFIEVKRRATRDDALIALQPQQQARIARAAEAFLQRHREFAAHDLRFDLVAVVPWRLPHHLVDAWRT